MNSIWQNTVSAPEFPSLEGDINTDVLIIGGGIAGILCGYRLSRAGLDCIIVEGGRICQGVTASTTAKMTLQHGFCYSRMIKKHGLDYAGTYYRANHDAMSKFKELACVHDCDYTERSSFVYTTGDRDDAQHEYEALLRLGAPAKVHSSLPLPLDVAAAVEVEGQAQFHPLKLMFSLSKELDIYENTFVHSIDGTTAITDNGIIRAKNIIVATHFPFINRHGFYYSKLYQHRSYVLALENGPQFDGMYVDNAESGMSFRNWENFLFIGGGDHKTGVSGGGYSELQLFAAQHFPDAPVRFAWSTQDCMSLDAVPYIGRYSHFFPNVFVATGFNKWGMTTAMAAATMLTSMITTGKNPYGTVFSPKRNSLNKQLLTNTANFFSSYLSASGKRCPHMGCALVWNPEESSWDCPCHGSRFHSDGKLIDNPAMKDLD